MKVNWIKVQNYRGIKKFELQKVAPVTVFVGRNNAGKSTLLEAFALGSTADVGWFDCLGEDLLRIIAEKRGGTNLANMMTKVGSSKSVITVSGENIGEGSVTITNTFDQVPSEARPVVFECIDRYVERKLEREKSRYTQDQRKRFEDPIEYEKQRDAVFLGSRAFIVYNSESVMQTAIFSETPDYERMEDLTYYQRPLRAQIIRSGAKTRSNVNFMLTPSSGYLRELQRKLVESGEMLRLIDFIKKEISYFEDIREVNGAFFVSLKGLERPIPLESMGDGFRANIAILSGIALARGGMVLIEEPEIRLHPGYISLIAKQVSETAAKQYTQYVISTHSSEFLESLLKESLDIVKIVRLYRSDDTAELDYEILGGAEALEEIKELKADLRGI